MMDHPYAVFVLLAILSLLPLWVGYRRKLPFLPMLFIMLVGLIPLGGPLVGLYIAFRAVPKDAQPHPDTTGHDHL